MFPLLHLSFNFLKSASFTFVNLLIGAIVGALVSWALQRWYEQNTKPKININTVISDSDLDDSDYKLLHLKILNKRFGKLNEFVWGKRNASYIKVIANLKLDGEMKEFEPRWVYRKWPESRVEALTQDPFQVLPYGEELYIDLFCKFKDKEEFKIHNHRSILEEDIEYQIINAKKVNVQINVRSEGWEWSEKFEVKNPSTSLEDFTIRKL